MILDLNLSLTKIFCGSQLASFSAVPGVSWDAREGLLGPCGAAFATFCSHCEATTTTKWSRVRVQLNEIEWGLLHDASMMKSDLRMQKYLAF